MEFWVDIPIFPLRQPEQPEELAIDDHAVC